MKTWKPIFWSFIRLLLILLLPLTFGVHIIQDEFQDFSYNCIFSRILNPQNIYFDPSFSPISLLYPILLVGSVVLISAPLMYFEFNLRRIPPEKSAKLSAFLLVLVSMALIFMMTYFSVLIYEFYWIQYDVVMVFTWSIIVFVVFPIIVRETRLLEHHMKKGGPAQKPKGYRPSNYTILGYVLGLLVSIGPYAYFTSSSNGWTNSSLYSISFTINQSAHSVYGSQITFYMLSYISGSLISLLILPNICFCIYLLRYFKGNAERTRVILIGLAGALSPFLLLVYYYSEIITVTPMPILIIAGLILMKIIPVVEIDESVWDETPKQMWFEAPHEMETQTMVFVKVPYRYMILCKLRKWRSHELVEEEL